MSYTQEQLKVMSDSEINCEMSRILGTNPRPFMEDEWDKVEGEGVVEEEGYLLSRTTPPDYCTDWSATGPLMAEHGVSLIFEPDEDGNVVVVEHKPSGIWSDNPSPLRSVCEVILMMGKA